MEVTGNTDTTPSGTDHQPTPRARAGGLLSAAALALTLGGCMTSPYWNQEFDDHTDPIPLQAWTTSKQGKVKFECAKAFHGGLYPFVGTVKWHKVANVKPKTKSYDPQGAVAYSAGKSMVLPAKCWHQDANDLWYSAVRASQPGIETFHTFTEEGLECLGTANGEARSWGGWTTAGCSQTFSGSNNPVPYVIFRALN